MKYIFCGFLFDKDKEIQLLSKSRTGVQSATNQYQKGFLKGIPEQVRIYSCLCVGTYPKKNAQLVFHEEKCDSEYGEIVYLPFLNLHGIKDFCFTHSLKQNLSATMKGEDQVVLFVYSLYYPFLKTVSVLKKKYGDRLQVCLIVPDLPGKYGIVRKWNSLGGIRDRWEADKKMKLARNADQYVFLTESMRELFPQKPYTVAEGFLPDIPFDYSQKRIPKLILYTGSLNSKYGILDLLEAFSKIEDPDYQLWICGAGETENEVRKYAQADSRMRYLGFLSKKEITALQTKCDILVNPRTPVGEYTKYSFPSKTMEYILSGSKVVMHRLEGIPEKYYQYLYPVESEDNTGLKDKLLEAGNDHTFYPERSSEQVRWIKEEGQPSGFFEHIMSNGIFEKV